MTVGFNASLHTHNRSPRAFVIDQEVKKEKVYICEVVLQPVYLSSQTYISSMNSFSQSSICWWHRYAV